MLKTGLFGVVFTAVMVALAVAGDGLTFLTGIGTALGLLFVAASIVGLLRVRGMVRNPPTNLGTSPADNLVFVRGETLQDALRSYQIKVDGEKVGTLPHGGTMGLRVAPGVHRCAARIGFTGSEDVEVTVPSDSVVRLLVEPASETPDARRALTRHGWLRLREVDAADEEAGRGDVG